MPVNKEAYNKLMVELKPQSVTVVAVSKTKSVEEIKELYGLGQRDFGENYVMELAEKQAILPADIRWHFIGHLQRNKVKAIIPYVHLIQGVDSLRLLKEINKQGEKINRVVDCLLQVHIAQEETKFGLDEEEINSTISQFDNLKMENVRIVGLMGMASFINDMDKVRNEFRYLKTLFDKHAKLSIVNCQLTILSMGMSGDYKIAMEEGSSLVRIGSLIFGERKNGE